MTLRELETYLALEIVGAYHARVHKGLAMPPVAAWAERIGAVSIRRPSDPQQFLIDFLPCERRVLQRDGLHLFHIRYWSDELRWLMGATQDKLTVKYDPRDLSRVFVRGREGYVEARPADLTRPAIALWEHSAALRALRQAGRKAVDEDLIFATILAQRALVDEAARATKATRRDAARRAHLAAPRTIDVTPSRSPGDDAPLALPYFEVEEWDFGHLFPASRALAALSVDERIRRIRADRWISYPRAQQALAKLEGLIACPQRARMPNLLIVGASGMGKTMIVEKFARDHPAHFDAVNGLKQMPVVVVQMVSGPDEARFYKRLLAAIGALEPPRATLGQLEGVVLRLLRETRPGILVIDEVHSLQAGTCASRRAS